MTVDFPFARSVVVVRSCRTVKKTGQTTSESRYYLSSAQAEQYTPAQWLGLVRDHWGGVEIRNHWRRDVLMGEDRSRSRNPNLLANLALMRNVLLAVVAEHFEGCSLPQIREQLNARPSHSLKILCS